MVFDAGTPVGTQPSAGRPEVWRDFFEVQDSRVVYSDASVVVFRDRRPKASSHLLVVPRYEALTGVESLQPRHVKLLAHMEAVAHELAPSGPHPLVLGFHRRPLRSVDHLHLHVLTPPFRPAWQKLRYSQPPLFPVAFIELSSLVQRLQHYEHRGTGI